MEIARLNPSIATNLYAVYSFYEILKEAHFADNVETNELENYLSNYDLLTNQLNE